MVPCVRTENGACAIVISEKADVEFREINAEKKALIRQLCGVLAHEWYVPTGTDIRRIEPEVDRKRRTIVERQIRCTQALRQCCIETDRWANPSGNICRRRNTTQRVGARRVCGHGIECVEGNHRRRRYGGINAGRCTGHRRRRWSRKAGMLRWKSMFSCEGKHTAVASNDRAWRRSRELHSEAIDHWGEMLLVRNTEIVMKLLFFFRFSLIKTYWK